MILFPDGSIYIVIGKYSTAALDFGTKITQQPKSCTYVKQARNKPSLTANNANQVGIEKRFKHILIKGK
jgi:hypothetical protein